VSYLADGGTVELRIEERRDHRSRLVVGRWFDPREGTFTSADLELIDGGVRAAAPDTADWVLVLD
jgi:hypothetical protein